MKKSDLIALKSTGGALVGFAIVAFILGFLGSEISPGVTTAVFVPFIFAAACESYKCGKREHDEALAQGSP